MKKNLFKKATAVVLCMSTMLGVGVSGVHAEITADEREQKSQEMMEWMEEFDEEYEYLSSLSFYEKLDLMTEEMLQEVGWLSIIEEGNVKYCMNGNCLKAVATKDDTVSEIKVPQEAEIIENEAFHGVKLKNDGKVILHENVTEVGPLTFYALEGLMEIEVDVRNQTYTSIDGVLFTKDEKTLVAYPSMRDAAVYVVPDSVETIVANAFGMFNMLKQVLYTDADGIACEIISEALADMDSDGTITLEDAQKTLKIALRIDSMPEAKVQAKDTEDTVSITLTTAKEVLKMALAIQ